MRENAEDKGRRYLVEGHVIVTSVARSTVAASVRGDGVVHQVRHDSTRGWSCTCPARGRCSHLLAVGLVIGLREHSAEPATTHTTSPRRTTA